MNRLEGKFSALQSSGKRDYQEDEFGLLEGNDSSLGRYEVMVVADGMGGHVAGAGASALATETFIDTFQHVNENLHTRLRQSLGKANQSIANAVANEPELEGMGTTLVAVVVRNSEVSWVSVGDSPLWLFREGELIRLNDDHSMAPVLAEMVESGKITAEQAASDPNRHSLLSALTGNELDLVDVSPSPVTLRDDDILLLSSDGLLTLSEDFIMETLQENGGKPLSEITRILMDEVEEAGHPAQDNITIVLYSSSEGVSPLLMVPSVLETIFHFRLTRLKLFFVISITLIIILSLLMFTGPDETEPLETEIAEPEEEIVELFPDNEPISESALLLAEPGITSGLTDDGKLPPAVTELPAAEDGNIPKPLEESSDP